MAQEALKREGPFWSVRAGLSCIDDDQSLKTRASGWRAGVFERDSRKLPMIDEEQVRDLHAKIGELAVATLF